MHFNEWTFIQNVIKKQLHRISKSNQMAFGFMLISSGVRIKIYQANKLRDIGINKDKRSSKIGTRDFSLNL